MNYLLAIAFVAMSSVSLAEDGHDHSGASESEKSHAGHDHKATESHDEHEGHDHDSEPKHEDHGDHSDHDDHGDDDDHSGHEGHGGSKAIGKNKAIVEVDEAKGFKLSPEAIQSLKLQLSPVNGSKFEIKKSTLVSSKSVKGIYRFRGGFFKLVPVKIISEKNGRYSIEAADITFGDQIVVNGLGLLRVADVYSTDKSEYGHSH